MSREDLDDFFNAWHFIMDHPMFRDDEGLDNPHIDIFVAKVNPITGEVDDDKSLNTKTEVWLECGPHISHAQLVKDGDEAAEHYPFGTPSHDTDLDCGAETYEQAIVILAKAIFDKYGDYDPDLIDPRLLKHAKDLDDIFIDYQEGNKKLPFE